MSNSTKNSLVVMAVAAVSLVWYLGLYRTNVAQPSYQASNEDINLIEGDGSWQRDVELTHRADQYDCIEAAIKQLSVQLVEFIERHQEKLDESVAVEMILEGEHGTDLKTDIDTWLERSLQLAVAEKLPNLRIQIHHSQSSAEMEAVDESANKSSKVELRLARLNVKDADQPGSQPLVLAPSVYFQGEVTALVPLQVAQKNWIRQWSTYRSSPATQSLRQYRAETIEQANSLMARDLAKRWRAQTSRVSVIPTLSESQATKLISQESARLGLCVDQFEQTFQLALLDGTEVPAMKRAALLVDLSPEKLEPALKLLSSSGKHQRDRFVGRLEILVPSAIVLLLAIFALDRVTMGYYTWRIRGAAFVVGSMILLLVV
jgi:hypothetical protein